MGISNTFPRQAPWWLTWVVAGALGALFFGERILAGTGLVRLIFSSLGIVSLTASIAWRTMSLRSAPQEARSVEKMLLACYVGCLVAVIGFFISSNDGMRLLGIEFVDRVAERRYETAVHVLSSIAVAVSLLPALGAQWALSAHRHGALHASQIETRRVKETAGAALTVAFAGAGLMLAGYVASEWNQTVDVSYFKTASPGTGAEEMTRNMTEPLEVLLFFPDVNEVKDEVLTYFRSLADATGNVEIREHDRFVSPELAREHTVSTDGAIVLIRGERSERIVFPHVIRTARARLRTLDQEIQEHLWSLARDQRTAYLTIGHGEYNDPTNTDGEATADPMRQVEILKEGLGVLNYKVENLGLQHGLAQAIPDDAAMVLVIGPRIPFLDEEINAIDRYLQRGGAALFALDPESEFRLGPLEERLGVRFQNVTLANDQQYVRRRGNLSDRQLIITDQFTAHESVTTLSRTRVGSGILLLGAGHLESAGTSGATRPRFVVRSLPTTFADNNSDYEFNASTETRRTYNLVAAIEETSPVDGVGQTSDGNSGTGSGPPDRTARMRALVYADAGMFTDPVLGSIALNTALLADGIRWLGGEEQFGGEIASEEDIPIVHTRAEDVAWFYSTILGAPLIILAAGITTVMRRRAGGRAI